MKCEKCVVRARCNPIAGQVGCCMGKWQTCGRRGRGWCQDEEICEIITMAGDGGVAIRAESHHFTKDDDWRVKRPSGEIS